MPPHCDTMDGPVVTAAKKALETGNVKLILPWAPAKTEGEITRAFEQTMKARRLGKEAKEVADLWFFETVVRLHREGEDAPYTGLKPAGLDAGPVIPRAEKAVESEDPKELVRFLQQALESQVMKRYNETIARKGFDPNNTDETREYVHALLELTLYTHHLYENMITVSGHEQAGMEEHPLTGVEEQAEAIGEYHRLKAGHHGEEIGGGWGH